MARSGDVGGGVCAGGGGDAGEDKPAEKVLAIEGGDDGGVDDRTRRRLESPRKTLPMGFMQVGGDQGRGARRVQSPHAINNQSRTPPWTHKVAKIPALQSARCGHAMRAEGKGTPERLFTIFVSVSRVVQISSRL